MKFKKGELVGIYKELKGVKENTEDVKTKYDIVKNMKEIQDEVNSLEEVSPQSIVEEFNQKRQEIGVKYAKKDDEGNPVVGDDKIILEDEESAKKEIKELNKKYKEPYEKAVNAYNEIAEEEIEVEFRKIKLSRLTKDVDVEIIFELIEEEEE